MGRGNAAPYFYQIGSECHSCACRYVSGDFRFKTYCRSNPRKMVKMWAEKELRNLARLKAAGLNVPAPIQLRMHVLVMEFVGEFVPSMT